MEKKIQLLDRIMRLLVLVSLGIWTTVTQGIFSFTTLILLVIVAAAVVSNKKNPVDERGWQIHFLATYGAFMAAICFGLLYEAVQYMKTSQVSPLAGYFLAVLMLSQLMFSVLLRKDVR